MAKNSDLDHAAASEVPAVASGTVLKAFNGVARRFPVGAVVTDADLADLPMSLADLKAAGLIAP
jgi:hypothetical protein